MRLHWNAILPIGVALLVAQAAPAASQNRSLDGSYTFVAAQSDDIKGAIESAVRGMNFITRPVARGRLTKTNSPYQSLSITSSPSEIRIVTDQRAPIVSPPSGAPVKWTREDGEVFDVTTRWVDGTLEQTFVADDGQRKNVFAMGADGALEMRVTVTSPRLSKPLTYTLRYRKQN